MTAFTPDDIERREPIRDDHPYSGLVFVSNTRDVRLERRRVSYRSSLSFGLLGTDVPGQVQNGLHSAAGDDKARGWTHQISDGGEPTGMWKVQRRQTHWLRRSPDRFDYEVISTVGASIGYVTQVSVGVNWRWGLFGSPWWSFNPSYGEYMSLGMPSGYRHRTELFLWGGVNLRRHFYNALLEGQFRDSEVTFERGDELDSTLWQAALGVTWRTANGCHLTFALRGEEPELRVGEDNALVWGSVVIGRDF